MVVRGAIANEFGAYTPLRWVVKGFGPLPAEFTKSGAIQIFEYTGLQRLRLMAISTASKFVLVTVAYEGGVLIGSMINQAIPERTQDAIGGTIDEIINQGGWKDLWRHPFGLGCEAADRCRVSTSKNLIRLSDFACPSSSFKRLIAQSSFQVGLFVSSMSLSTALRGLSL